jgi:hypothetical protein
MQLHCNLLRFSVRPITFDRKSKEFEASREVFSPRFGESKLKRIQLLKIFSFLQRHINSMCGYLANTKTSPGEKLGADMLFRS